MREHNNSYPRPFVLKWSGWIVAAAVAWGLNCARLAEGGEIHGASAGKATPGSVQDLAGASVRPLADSGQKATVLFFVMHECPVANGYAPEIVRICSEYSAKGMRCFVVYVENDLTLERARIHARDYGY